MAPDDKILFVQTFSKNWAMTGWRIGWLEAPPALAPAIENLVQFSTSGVPVSAQRAAIAALDEGEPFLGDSSRACAPRATSSATASRRPGGFASRVPRPRSISSARSREKPTRAGSRSASSTRRDRRGAGRGFRSRRRGLSAHMFRARARRNGRGDPPIRALAQALHQAPINKLARIAPSLSRNAPPLVCGAQFG